MKFQLKNMKSQVILNVPPSPPVFAPPSQFQRSCDAPEGTDLTQHCRRPDFPNRLGKIKVVEDGEEKGQCAPKVKAWISLVGYKIFAYPASPVTVSNFIYTVVYQINIHQLFNLIRKCNTFQQRPLKKNFRIETAVINISLHLTSLSKWI